MLCLRPCAAFAAASLTCLQPLVVTPDPAEARGFRAVFRSAGRAIDNVPSARPMVRSAEHIAVEARRESQVNWSEVADKGLEAAKTAFDIADKGGSAGGGSSSPSGGQPVTGGAFAGSTLSRIELEACVREANTLDGMSEAYDGQRAAMEAERTGIQKQQAEIEAARSRVDRSSKRSVNAFNALVDGYQKRVARFNDGSVRPLEQRRLAMNDRGQKFNSYCNGKSYYQSDLTAVESRVGIKLGNK